MRVHHQPRPEDRQQLIAELREAVRKIERRPARRGGVVPCGLPEVDAALPQGGFPRGAICELSGGRASGKMAVALSLLTALGGEDLFAWIDGRGELYPPAAAARGVDLGRLLVVRPPAAVACPRPSIPPSSSRPQTTSSGSSHEQERISLWVAEALLGSAAFSAVVVDVPVRGAGWGWEAMAHRLQAAAEKGGAVGLWLASPRVQARIPAALKLELTAEGGRVVARRDRGVTVLGASGGGRVA